MFYSNVDHIFGIGGEECLKIKSRKKKGNSYKHCETIPA